MDNIHIEEGQISEAQRIAQASGLDSLFESQLSYWLTVQSIMQSPGGYDDLKKRMPHISFDLAEKIQFSNYHEIVKLCTSMISTIRPALPEQTIIGLIENSNTHNKSISTLQLLAS
ncbi:MAG: hypothetical protein HOB14_07160 [Gammaproteobacteria bacterium]|jgi:hypothetical protein|nr:hypothetical protein [Gammaproteobacteria bacterium]MBT6701424.1 hypothetical protein [Gammaproteobacteria bacterium]